MDQKLVFTTISQNSICNTHFHWYGREEENTESKMNMPIYNPMIPGELLSEIEITNGRLTKPNLKRLLSKTRSNESDESGPADWLPNIANQLQEISDDKELQLITADPARISIFLAMGMSRFFNNENRHYFDLDSTLQQLRGELSRVQIYHIFPNSLRHPQKVADSHPLAEGGENLASTLKEMIQRGNPYLEDLKAALSYAVPGVFQTLESVAQVVTTSLS